MELLICYVPPGFNFQKIYILPLQCLYVFCKDIRQIRPHFVAIFILLVVSASSGDFLYTPVMCNSHHRNQSLTLANRTLCNYKCRPSSWSCVSPSVFAVCHNTTKRPHKFKDGTAVNSYSFVFGTAIFQAYR